MIGLILYVNTIMCDIKGEVKNPGVYISDNNNINDIINKAGGLTKEANVQKINLSKKVYDEMVIYIPSKKEKKKECEVCICPEIKCIPKTEIIPSTTKYITEKITTTREITTTKKTIININIDPLEDLLLINGIGEVIANRIIEYRKENPFIYTSDILNIKGVGEALFAKIKDFITV